MNNEITVKNDAVNYAAEMQPIVNMDFSNANQGTIAIEASRAIAEAQSRYVMAKKFPRNETQAYARVAQACKRKGLADKAFYSYSRGGSTVSGPTIRFAEELARCWGNIEFGLRELSQDDGKSEMQAFAIDVETNTVRSQNFTNPHMREVGGKAKKLTSQRDIYEINANMGARRLRAQILAILPADLVDMAIFECKRTIAGNNEEPLIDRVRKMIIAFEKYGVSQKMIEARLKREAESMTSDDFVEYIGIYNALKEGVSKISDWFESPKEASDLTQDVKAKANKEESK